jgi:hypothetical protein
MYYLEGRLWKRQIFIAKMADVIGGGI